MESFRIEGGIPLRGEVTPSGNKNAALPLLCAAILTEEPVILHNVPMIRDVLDRLYQPRVRLEKATGLLEIVDLRKDGKLMIQLVNANGNHRAAVIATEDQIPPCLDAEIAIRLPQKPASLRLEPLGKELSFTYEDGEARVRIPRIDLHEVIVVDE